jgi:hypothetical protein
MRGTLSDNDDHDIHHNIHHHDVATHSRDTGHHPYNNHDPSDYDWSTDINDNDYPAHLIYDDFSTDDRHILDYDGPHYHGDIHGDITYHDDSRP